LSTGLIRTGLHYHTSSDLVENIEPQAVEAVLQIAIRFILEKEKEIQK
jgi:aminopeptidase YwaD